MTQQIRGSLFVLASAATFSAEAILVKLAYATGMSGFGITVYRMLLAAAISAPVFLHYALSNKLGLQFNLRLFGMGGVLHSSVVVLLTLAIGRVDASVAILCLYLYPALTTMLAVPILSEKATARKITSLVGALIGVTLVVWAPGVALDSTGVILAFLAALVNSVYLVSVKRWALSLPPFVCSSGLLMYSGISLSLASLLGVGSYLGEGPASSLASVGSLPLESMAYIAALSIFATVLPLMLLYKGMAIIEASLSSIISTTEPVMTAVVAFFVLGERLGFRQIMGGLLVFLSTLILGFG